MLHKGEPNPIEIVNNVSREVAIALGAAAKPIAVGEFPKRCPTVEENAAFRFIKVRFFYKKNLGSIEIATQSI
jgi:hypothetical protein